MNFLELSKQRYSARNYSSDMIEQEKLDYILECARFAPSAVNYQPWHFFIVKSDIADDTEPVGDHAEFIGILST